MTGRKLSDEEKRAWARVARTIKPIAPQTEDFSALVSEIEGGGPVRRRPRSTTDVPTPGKPQKPSGAGLADRNSEKRVRRGRLVLHAELDLHGMTQADAERALPGWLSRCQQEGARSVLVITGKGRGGDGVLRRNFLAWLQTPGAQTSVSGYSEAHQRHGGSGAFYVFLRRPA